MGSMDSGTAAGITPCGTEEPGESDCNLSGPKTDSKRTNMTIDTCFVLTFELHFPRKN